jgi:hypothetical protein
VRRRHRSPSTGTLICEPEVDISRSHAVRLCTRYMYAAPRTLTCLEGSALRAQVPWIELSRPQVMLLKREHGQRASRAFVGLQMACPGAHTCNDGWRQRQVRWYERGRRLCGLERDLPTPSSHPVCLCVAQQQALDCASLFKPQRRLLYSSCGLQQRGRSWKDTGPLLGQPGRAWSRLATLVVPCARALCVGPWAGSGQVESVQRPLFASLWAAMRASTGA